MKRETRNAALRAAAQVAFVVTAACTSSATAPSAPSAPRPADTAQTCKAYLDGLATTRKPSELPEGDPLRGRADVYGAFTDRAARDSKRTRDCCALSFMDHRWECCSALDNKTPAGVEPQACTPWGPPAPPAMA
jgi:hypothetical protein